MYNNKNVFAFLVCDLSLLKKEQHFVFLSVSVKNKHQKHAPFLKSMKVWIKNSLVSFLYFSSHYKTFKILVPPQLNVPGVFQQ